MNLFSFIKENVPILTLIGEHVSLKKAGHYWKGRCPFHDEKTASFTVSPHRDIYYCFGCHSGGDAISFMSKLENCSQIESAKLLADRYNLDIPEQLLSQDTMVQVDKKKHHFELCRLVAEWCHSELQKHASVKAYLTKRNISESSITQFMVGYFPGGSRGLKSLTNFLKEENFLAKDLIDAGIVSEGKMSLHSPFEQRIIFPIRDHLGRFCGFGGRVFKSGDERAKYYNSRENDHFQKGSILFGLDLAKKEIQKKEAVFLVEGYTDCIAMAQYGFKNSVATLGTSCSLEHLQSLAHHAQTAYLVYDGDTAGKNAMLRLVELCWQVSLDLEVIQLPTGQDPASYLENKGDLQADVSQAKDIFAFFIDTMGSDFSTHGLQYKLNSARKCLEVIKNLKDPLKRDILLQQAASSFGIPFESLQAELKRMKAPSQAQLKSGPIETNNIEKIKTISTIEKKFLYAIFNDTKLIERKEVVQLFDYLPETYRLLVNKLREEQVEDETIRFRQFFDSLTQEEKRLVQELAVRQEEQEASDDMEQIILLLEKKYWKTIVHTTKVHLAQAQAEHDTKRVQDIVGLFLKRKKKLLRKGLI